jgi:hypothetical protein
LKVEQENKTRRHSKQGYKKMAGNTETVKNVRGKKQNKSKKVTEKLIQIRK